MARVGDVREGEATRVQVGRHDIAIFNLGGRFFALSNVCVHQGGPLCEGAIEGTRVSCPWHGWQFDITSGECVFDPDTRIPTFDTRIEDGFVKVIAVD